ncbi:hypothetical protein P7K49_040830, partial [Saguinus oedipus]
MSMQNRLIQQSYANTYQSVTVTVVQSGTEMLPRGFLLHHREWGETPRLRLKMSKDESQRVMMRVGE